ncbi:MFS transporter [Limosilactobacillus sp.]|uniref:MFS transporter n=1 Tax=Limosilactobacillus sp. TaxID=2773925 RepID=UPI00345EEF3B
MQNNTKTPARVYVAIFSMALMTFLGILNETSMNVTYPILSREFNISLDVTQWITAGYLLTVTIVMGTTAYLLRQFSARRIQMACVAIFIIGDVMCALAPNFGTLLGGRLIQAVATGLSTPTMFFLIINLIPRNRLATMTGLGGMVISFAPALGPTYGGAIVGSWSWRMIFWLLLPFAIISLIAGQLTIRNEPVGNDKAFSWGSLLTLAISLFAIIDAVSTVGSKGVTMAFWLMIAVAIIFFAIFMYLNQHGQSQLFDTSVFKLPTIRLASISYFALQFINIGISLVIPVYSQYTLHASSFVAGIILLPGSILGAFMSPLAGRLADRHGFALPVILGSCLLVIGASCFAFWQNHLTPWKMMWFFMIERIGFNSAFANTLSNSTTLVEEHQAADINSIFNMTQQFAGSLGVGLLTALMAVFQNRGTGTMAARTFQGGQLDFWLLYGLAVLTLILFIANYTIQRIDNMRKG